MGTVPTPPLNVAHAKDVAIGFFREVIRNDPNSRLRELHVCFTRLEEYDRGQTCPVTWPMCVRRLERDDAARLEDGEYEFESEGKWIGGW